MRQTHLFLIFAATSVAALACDRSDRTASDTTVASEPSSPARTVAADSGESRFGQVRQLTFGGENAEAYFSADGSRLIFQSTRDGRGCDQQFIMDVDGGNVHMVSTGKGRTTCGYFYAGDDRILYSSTQAADSACPEKPDPSKGYVWGLDPYEIYTARPDGSDLRQLTDWHAYTAEATLSPDGQTIVFTSTKDGDLDIYTMSVDGSNLRRLTSEPGYDGGAFFSPDGTQIVYRAYHPTDPSELAAYRDLLSNHLVRPNLMEIWVMNADGTGQRQITSLGGANFAPFFAPDGQQIIFSSNYKDPHSGNFDLYLINVDGSGLEQVTTNETFDGFPMFSPDGSKLVWASNRLADDAHETNLFIAEWRGRTTD
jgi:Tol biopolymer transport system component